jgi:hypothetical protein
MGAAGRRPAVLSEVMRRLEDRGQLDRMIDIFQHRAMPSRVVTPPLLLSTAAMMLTRRGNHRREVLRDVRRLVATDISRQRLRRRPEFVDPAVHADAGETEVTEAVAA